MCSTHPSCVCSFLYFVCIVYSVALHTTFIGLRNLTSTTWMKLYFLFLSTHIKGNIGYNFPPLIWKLHDHVWKLIFTSSVCFNKNIKRGCTYTTPLFVRIKSVIFLLMSIKYNIYLTQHLLSITFILVDKINRLFNFLYSFFYLKKYFVKFTDYF